MFKQFFEAFWPKAVDYVAEQGLNSVLNIKDSEHNLETLHKNLKSLCATAFDVEKEIKNGEDSGRKKRKREVDEWLGDVKSIETEVNELGSKAESEGFIIRFLGGGKASQLNEQVEKLLQQRLNFGEPVLDARGSRGESLLTDEMVGVAFKENSETILKILEDRQVSKIGVYGMGGVGKTTLAKHVYNRLVQDYEGRVVWVTVSQEFTIKSLQDKIAHFIGVKLEDEDEEAIRAARLDRFLYQKKISMMILDDVWEKIDMKKVGCTFAVECCRLIITTRSREVCHRIGCKKLIPVVKLGKDDAWELFLETLENETELGPQVEEIGKSMAELCGGLPLGIITLAGSMKGETAIHMWRNALAELKDCVGGQGEMEEVDEVFRVLKYSFDRLNRNYQSQSNEFNTIQLCFMYCSLHAEDYEMIRGDLVRNFISDGLLDERKSRRTQIEQGLSILDKLVNACLLESCVDHNNLECVKMHDLVRSMALRISKGIYMVRAGERSSKEILNEEEWTKDLEKVSFMKCGNLVRIREGISPDCPKLSTMLLWGNHGLKVIPESFFFKMQGLCTLDLYENFNIEILPDSISDLTSLKALLLEYCFKLEKVPYLGKLKALKELNLSGTAIKEVPQGVEELSNLRYLSINAHKLKLFRKGLLLKFGHLEYLNLLQHMQVEIEEIKNLKQLEVFGGGVKNVSDFNWFIRNQGVHQPCYRIAVNSNSNIDTSVSFFMWGLHKNELVLRKCNLKDEKVLGQWIVYLTIIECEGLSKCFADDLSTRFDNPTSLESLSIERCGGIEWILRSDGQGSQITLEEIHVYGLDDLKGVVMERGEIGPSTAPAQPLVFSSLKSLFIYECKKMRKVGLPISGLPNLKRFVINSCGEIEEIFEEDEGRAASILTTLPKLQVLRLEGLRRLKRVSKATIICNSIEEIDIKECPRLINKFPLDMDALPPPFLKYIRVEREWWESLEWDNPDFPCLLLPFVEFED